LGLDPREYCIMTKGFIGDDQKNVKGLRSKQIHWEGGTDNVPPKEIGTERIWPAQLVLLAMGFVGPEKEGLLAQLGVRLTERGTVSVDEDHMTSVSGVFAAGDMERGQSLVVWAIADGRKAAAAVDRYLTGTERYLTSTRPRTETRIISATETSDRAKTRVYAHASAKQFVR